MPRIQQEKRQAAEMIAMKMADHDAVDAVGIDALMFQRDEAGRAAIDEKAAARSGDEETGIESTATAERIAATDKSNLHRREPPSRASTTPPTYCRWSATARSRRTRSQTPPWPPSRRGFAA